MPLSSKARLHVYVDPALKAEVERMAHKERRSVNGQIEVILRQSLRAYAAKQEAA